MLRIVLICSAGMSTSLMVNKMKKSASEKGIDAEIWAVADAEAVYQAEKADILMLGPQVRFLQSKMKEIAKGKPVEVIDMKAYGSMNGKLVLEQAITALNK